LTSGDGERLFDLYRRLGRSERDALLAFAEFLLQRSGAATGTATEAGTASDAETRTAGGEKPLARVPTEPVPIERPAKESVVAAIKRLRRTYPMLERNAMLNEVYVLMNQHMLEGRPAQEVIGELEEAFERRYREWLADGVA